MEQAENMLLKYLMEQDIPKGKVPLAGNSVYMDRLFLRDVSAVSNLYFFKKIFFHYKLFVMFAHTSSVSYSKNLCYHKIYYSCLNNGMIQAVADPGIIKYLWRFFSRRTWEFFFKTYIFRGNIYNIIRQTVNQYKLIKSSNLLNYWIKFNI